jgi:hypothetical protein
MVTFFRNQSVTNQIEFSEKRNQPELDYETCQVSPELKWKYDQPFFA